MVVSFMTCQCLSVNPAIHWPLINNVDHFSGAVSGFCLMFTDKCLVGPQSCDLGPCPGPYPGSWAGEITSKTFTICVSWNETFQYTATLHYMTEVLYNGHIISSECCNQSWSHIHWCCLQLMLFYFTTLVTDAGSFSIIYWQTPAVCSSYLGYLQRSCPDTWHSLKSMGYD